MARVQNPLIGTASGSVGGVTFTSWKGINVVKTKPVQVANPRTPTQVSNRNKFAAAVKLYRELSAEIKKGYQSLASKMSAYNAFVSDNLKRKVFTDSDDAYSFDFEALKIAKGTIPDVRLGLIEVQTSAKKLNINWDSTLVNGESASDKIICVVYDYASSKKLAISDTALRSAGTTSITHDALQNGATDVYLYVFAYNEGTRQSSDSRFVYLENYVV